MSFSKPGLERTSASQEIRWGKCQRSKPEQIRGKKEPGHDHCVHHDHFRPSRMAACVSASDRLAPDGME